MGGMGIEFDIATPEGWHAALAALAWQVDLGVTEVIADTPVNGYTLPDKTKSAAPAQAARVVETMPTLSPEQRAAAEADHAVDAAKVAAASASTLDALREAMARFDLCELKKGARNLVFADGVAGARVMVLGEAPGREEDMEGKPFVGPAGVLLDRMFAAIGLSRQAEDKAAGLYVTPVLPWRPPQREPTPEELAMLRPFVERHITLANPDVIVAMGNAPCAMLLGAKGVLRLRGNWAEALGKPVMPMVSPAQLLRNPLAKRDAWADLLAIKTRLSA